MVFHELRTFRMNTVSMVAAMHDRVEKYMFPLFREHGITPVAAWETVIGKDLPSFRYMLEWEDLGGRAAAFTRFYGDPRVGQFIQETSDAQGGYFVRDYDIDILKPGAYLADPFGAAGTAAGGRAPIHELRTYRMVTPSMIGHMHSRMERHMIPLFEEHDLHAVGAWEVTIGRNMPLFFYMLEFDDLEHRERAFGEFYADPRVAEFTESTIAAAGGPFVRDFDVEILQPGAYLAEPFGARA